MTCDVTVTDTLAESYIQATSSTAGASAAESAADPKELKYQSMAHTHTFILLAFENLGPINLKGSAFLIQLGRRLSACTGDMQEIGLRWRPKLWLSNSFTEVKQRRPRLVLGWVTVSEDRVL